MDDAQVLTGLVHIGGKEGSSWLAGADEPHPLGKHRFDLGTLTFPDPPSADEDDRLRHDGLLGAWQAVATSLGSSPGGLALVPRTPRQRQLSALCTARVRLHTIDRYGRRHSISSHRQRRPGRVEGVRARGYGRLRGGEGLISTAPMPADRKRNDRCCGSYFVLSLCGWWATLESNQ